jgi:hypothetical protein
MTNSIWYGNLSFAHPLTLSHGRVVEAGGIEPPSANPLRKDLHA